MRKAEADLAVAKKLRRANPPLFDAQCFHCQQAAEKFLKALLQEQKITIPRSHDLAALLDLVVPLYPTLKSHKRPLGTMTHFAVDFRYPRKYATSRQAQLAIEKVLRLRKKVFQELGIKSFPLPRRKK